MENTNVQDFQFIEQFLKAIDTPYALAFIAIWVIHYGIKQSTINNKYILPILGVVGGVLGYLLFDSAYGHVGNVIMGAVVAGMQYGAFGAFGGLVNVMKK